MNTFFISCGIFGIVLMLNGVVGALNRVAAAIVGAGIREETAKPGAAFGDRYGYSGWHEGDTDCDPAEPGKEWITIGPVDEDGYVTDEVAVIMLRTDGVDPNLVKLSRAGKEYAAAVIVAALNNEPVVYPAGVD